LKTVVKAMFWILSLNV